MASLEGFSARRMQARKLLHVVDAVLLALLLFFRCLAGLSPLYMYARQLTPRFNRFSIDSQMLDDFGCSREEASWGRTKIFIRSPRTLFLIEDARKLKIIEIIIKVQAKWRGFVALREFKLMKHSANKIAATFKGFKRRKKFLKTRDGAILITSFFRMWRERRKFEEHQVKIVMIKAAFVVTAWAKGYYVRQIKAVVAGKTIMGGTNKLFKRNAGPLLVKNLVAYQRRAWLRRTAKALPGDSPGGNNTVHAAPAQQKAAAVVERLYEEWRNRKYRLQLDAPVQAIMREKVVSSFLFRGKKSSYPGSVGEAFLGDQIGLNDDLNGNNVKWQAAAALVDQQLDKVLVATPVKKVHRRNGDEVDRNFIVTDTAFMMLDTKMRFKYHVLLAEIKSITCSTHSDGYFVLHVNYDDTKGKNKGDHMYFSKDVVEIITRIYIAIYKKEERELPVKVDDGFEITIKQKQEKFTVNVARSTSQSDDATAAVKHQKRGKMSIVLPEEIYVADGKSKRGGEERRFVKEIINDLRNDTTPRGPVAIKLPRTNSEPNILVTSPARSSNQDVSRNVSAEAVPNRTLQSAPVIKAAPAAVATDRPKLAAIGEGSKASSSSAASDKAAPAKATRGGRGRGRGRG